MALQFWGVCVIICLYSSEFCTLKQIQPFLSLPQNIVAVATCFCSTVLTEAEVEQLCSFGEESPRLLKDEASFFFLNAIVLHTAQGDWWGRFCLDYIVPTARMFQWNIYLAAAPSAQPTQRKSVNEDWFCTMGFFPAAICHRDLWNITIKQKGNYTG